MSIADKIEASRNARGLLPAWAWTKLKQDPTVEVPLEAASAAARRMERVESCLPFTTAAVGAADDVGVLHLEAAPNALLAELVASRNRNDRSQDAELVLVVDGSFSGVQVLHTLARASMSLVAKMQERLSGKRACTDLGKLLNGPLIETRLTAFAGQLYAATLDYAQISTLPTAENAAMEAELVGLVQQLEARVAAQRAVAQSRGDDIPF